MDSPVAFEDRIFSVQGAADYLTVSKGYIYKMIAGGHLRSIKLGSRTVFRGAELSRFIAAAADPPAPKKRVRRAA